MNTRAWLFAPVFFLFFLVDILPMPAQDAVKQRICIFLNVNLAGDDENAKYQGIITDTLTYEFEKIGFSVVPAAQWEAIRSEQKYTYTDLIYGPHAVKVALAAGAIMAVTGFFYIEESRITLEIKCYDALKQQYIAGSYKSGLVGLSVYNLISSAFQEMQDDIQKYRFPTESVSSLPEESSNTKPAAIIPFITLKSVDEEMEIYLAGDQRAGKIVQGILVLTGIYLTTGSEIIIEKRKSGYHAETEKIRLKEGQTEVELKPLVKEHRKATGLSLTTGQLLGLGTLFRYYFLPDSCFLETENYLYVQNSFSGNSHPVIHDDLRVMIGYYLVWGPNSLFRFSLSSGFGLVLTFYTVPDMPINTDFYFNLVNLSFELNFNSFSLFFRNDFKYFLGMGDDLLGRRWGNIVHGPPPMSIGVYWKW